MNHAARGHAWAGSRPIHSWAGANFPLLLLKEMSVLVVCSHVLCCDLVSVCLKRC